MRKNILCSILAAFLISMGFYTPARAFVQSSESYYSFGTVYVNPILFHGMFFDDKLLIDDNYLLGGRVGLGLSQYFGVEFMMERSPTEISPEDTPNSFVNSALYDFYGGNIRVNLPLGRVLPFATLGIGRSELQLDYWMDMINNYPVTVESKVMKRDVIYWGVGTDIYLNQRWAVRVDLMDHIIDEPFIQTAWYGKEKTHNWQFGASFSYAFGNEINDSDGDGVDDKSDECPGTPQKVDVYSNGCPVDTDQDGVPDYIDQCPDTEAGEKVDYKGCKIEEMKMEMELKDSDGDGVFDKWDVEANTPKGALADAKGRALDHDKDGVPDGLDKCPNTPQGLKVDSKGCFLSEQFAVRVLFDFGKSNVKAEYFDELNRVADLIIGAGCKLNLNLVGYTDPVGSVAANQKLSQKRAQAVGDYLSSRGVCSLPIDVSGQGEYQMSKRPEVSSNAMMRCVIIKAYDVEE